MSNSDFLQGGLTMKRLMILLLALLLLTGCAPEPNVVDLGGKPVTYDSTEEMAEAAGLIVTGVVLSADSRIERLTGDQVTSALTISEFQVTAVEKGDVQPGDVIKVWQDSAYDPKTNTIYQFGAASPLTARKEYQLYLRPRESGSEYYVAVSFQGIIPNS